MKRLLVTGAGFIISNFIEMYHRDYEITVFDNFNYASQANRVKHLIKRTALVDCADKLEVESAFEWIYENEGAFDVVICAHAETHNCNSIERPGDFIQSNIVGTYNMLEMCRKYGITNNLFISTDEVLKHTPPKEIFEDTDGFPYILVGKYYSQLAWNLPKDKHKKGGKYWDLSRIIEEGSVLAPTSPYSSSKAAGELLVSSWRQTYGLPVTIVRPTNQYGPNQNKEKLIPMICSKVRIGERVPVFKTPAYRDWMYVTDLCKALKLLLETENREDLYHCSAYNETETLEITKRVLNLLGKDESCIEMVPDRKAYDLYYSLDSSKLRELGWKPEVSLEEGLARTVEHYAKFC